MNITVKWEIDIEVEEGSAPAHQRHIAAARIARGIQRCSNSTATVFICNGKQVDISFLDNFETRRALSFNGDLWFWTLTPEETERVIASSATRTYKQVFPKLMRYIQAIADKLEFDIVMRDCDGNELTTIEPTEKTK